MFTVDQDFLKLKIVNEQIRFKADPDIPSTNMKIDVAIRVFTKLKAGVYQMGLNFCLHGSAQEHSLANIYFSISYTTWISGTNIVYSGVLSSSCRHNGLV